MGILSPQATLTRPRTRDHRKEAKVTPGHFDRNSDSCRESLMMGNDKIMIFELRVLI